MALIAVTKTAPQDLDQRLGGALDYVPYTPSNTAVIPDDLGFWPRGIRANAAGTLVVWFEFSDEARTLTVTAGEILLGPVVRVGEATSVAVHLLR